MRQKPFSIRLPIRGLYISYAIEIHPITKKHTTSPITNTQIHLLSDTYKIANCYEIVSALV